MTRRPMLTVAALAVAGASLTGVGSRAQSPAPSAAGRPNIVLIITDDVGYGDIGSYGAPDIKTPNIDSLARAGVRLTDFYANAALCSPTRAGLVTGRYQQRFAIEAALGGVSTAEEQGLPASGRSLPRLLKTSGYATALFGKWHLGYKPEFSPNAHGYDYLYMTDLITAKTVRFIEQNAAKSFFAEVAYNAGNARHLMPHDATSTRADYVAMMERADQGVREILRTLDRRTWPATPS